jgi:hypothetical protein
LSIDIDKLSEEELVDLNHRIVERLRFLNQMRAHSQMLDFKVGDRVTFQAEGRRPLVGILTAITRKRLPSSPKMASIGTFRPGLLRKVQSSDRTDTGKPKVVRLRRVRP